MNNQEWIQKQPSSNGRAVVVHKETYQSFSGPLPHPEILRLFNEAVPGSAERIIKMAEEQSAHRRDLEKKVIESDVASSKWGQTLGFIIDMTGLMVSAVVAIYGNAWAGTIIGVGTIASLVGVFMYGSNARSKEREEKRDQDAD